MTQSCAGPEVQISCNSTYHSVQKQNKDNGYQKKKKKKKNNTKNILLFKNKKSSKH